MNICLAKGHSSGSLSINSLGPRISLGRRSSIPISQIRKLRTEVSYPQVAHPGRDGARRNRGKRNPTEEEPQSGERGLRPAGESRGAGDRGRTREGGLYLRQNSANAIHLLICISPFLHLLASPPGMGNVNSQLRRARPRAGEDLPVGDRGPASSSAWSGSQKAGSGKRTTTPKTPRAEGWVHAERTWGCSKGALREKQNKTKHVHLPPLFYLHTGLASIICFINRPCSEACGVALSSGTAKGRHESARGREVLGPRAGRSQGRRGRDAGRKCARAEGEA